MTTVSLKYERILLVAPLGLRFWDEVTSAFITDGLRVTAHPKHAPARAVSAIASPSGVYGFVRLPGVRDREPDEADDAYWASLPARDFVVAVADPEGRFLPCTFAVKAPAQQIGGMLCGGVPAAKVPLFSAPSRGVSSPIAVIRADLREPDKKPAASALVEALLNGNVLARGLSNEHGNVALFFPYPEIAPGGMQSLGEQKWTIRLRVQYAPANPREPVMRGPDLCRVLAQPAATLLDALAPDVPLPDQTLSYGETLIVKSNGKSHVWVQAQ